MGWEFPSENSLMMTSLITSSKKSNKQEERRFHSDPGATDFFYVCGKLLDIGFGENERELIEV